MPTPTTTDPAPAPPETPSAATPPGATPPGATRRGRIARLLPGLALSLLAAVVAIMFSRAVPQASPALVAILLVAALTNLAPLPPALRPGLALASRAVLRLGIVLLGLQLAVGDILALGPGAIVLVVAVVALGVGAGALAGRMMRLGSAQSLLVACGMSICGAAAVAAVRGSLAPTPRPGEDAQAARERLDAETGTAVALVVALGTLMIPLLPLAAAALSLPEGVAGIWTGASVPEVAQVVAVGSVLGPQALKIAVVVKLGRVVLLAPLIALVTARTRREAREAGSTTAAPPLVPLFVLGFLAAVAVRSFGFIPEAAVAASSQVASLLLAAAMFALGTGLRRDVLRTAAGRPLLLALAVLGLVTALGLVGAFAIA